MTSYVVKKKKKLRGMSTALGMSRSKWRGREEISIEPDRIGRHTNNKGPETNEARIKLDARLRLATVEVYSRWSG